jgi:hypothetical protein
LKEKKYGVLSYKRLTSKNTGLSVEQHIKIRETGPLQVHNIYIYYLFIYGMFIKHSSSFHAQLIPKTTPSLN